MKYSHFAGFEKHLIAAAPQNFSPLYVVLAKDENERKLALSKMKKFLAEQLHTQWQTFNAKDTNENDIFSELETLSFLLPCKAVHIDEIQHFKKPALDQLERFFTNPPKNLYLLLSGSDLKAQTAFYKKAEKCGIVLDIAEEKPWEKEKSLQEWVVKEAMSLGKHLLAPAAQLFIKALGNDVLLLNEELNKLCCYVGEREEIFVEDVRAITSLTHQENSWQLGDALFKRNAPAAFRISRGILAQEIPFFVLLRQLRTQFQTAFQLASLQSAEIREEFPHLKDATIERYRTQARDFGYASVSEALRTIDQVEWMAKNGEDRYDFLSDLLIFKLTTINYERCRFAFAPKSLDRIPLP